MSVEDVDRELVTAVGKLDATTERINAALDAWKESHDTLGRALDGAANPEVVDVLDLQEAAADQLDEARAAVALIRDRISRYRASIGAGASSDGKSKPPGQERLASPRRPSNAVGVDGTEYPPEAAWAVPELPPRVQQKGDHTVGKVKIGNRPIPGAFRSDQGDVWVQEAQKRIKELGIRAWPYVPFHVEMRAAAMMVRSRVTSSEVVINNVPCGYQNQPPGCHQVLEPFLPEGSQMTVSGTDRKGRPYRRTYHGKAKR
ncbi:SCP1.201-like deaminase [Saccharopolyspora antimicrobica]|uniref:Nucleic acid/nucleotide deaminase of polymorphic system toxin n=1 Tax=Saccharopolyspora antimicrobica TaxID=455193 RepID=A0A1I4VG48_9PSEU|nr:DddA-like double-stranded DNA deaminase toxin [Saccharopolyspora antimicrobica]RKT86286.1 nucleic acid/nucleotide deaminase of polymorphic system toxin [Saccharopolyspora antimicrobica]SFN00096.1 SCP1.201-like deaminase [Saccharopolyspora antimicrobica]